MRRNGPAKGTPQRGDIRKGQKHRKTLEKLAHEELVRAMVAKALGPMTEAQIAAATGYKHLVARDKQGGKFKSITPEEVAKLNDGDLVTEIWEKHPSPEAYRNLLDRSYGRPTERLQADVNVEAGPKLAILLANLKKVGNGHG